MMSILQMSLSAGLLVIAIVIFRAAALNKLPKTMFLVLWGVALCRLLLPVSIPSRFSVYSILGRTVTRIAFNAPISVTNNVSPAESLIAGTTVQIAPAVQPAIQEQVFSAVPTAMIWVAGMTVTFLFFAIVYFKNYRELRFALPVSNCEFINEWLAEHRPMRSFTVLQSDRITTPLAVGLAKPRIVLPKTMNMDDKQLMGYVLTHEYYHIKRFDMLWKLLLAVALCIHWFNPLVWLMFVLVNRDLELTCDEMVVRRFGAGTKKAYACSLIGMAEQRSKFSPLYNGFSKNAAEERITAIMKYKKSSVVAIVLAALVVAGTTTAFALSGVNANADKEKSETPSGLSDTAAIIKLADLDTNQAQYQITSVNYITSRPDFEFYIEGEDIAKIELSSETEYLQIIDWTGTQTNPYSKDGVTSITNAGRTIDKTATLTFDEGFTDYGQIWYRWTGYNLYTWASENDYSHFLGIGGIMGNMTPPDNLSEEDKLKLAAGDDGLGTTGLGHIQLDGYPEELLKDRITIKFTDREGNVATRYVNIKISNNELRQLVATASLEN